MHRGVVRQGTISDCWALLGEGVADQGDDGGFSEQRLPVPVVPCGERGHLDWRKQGAE